MNGLRIGLAIDVALLVASVIALPFDTRRVSGELVWCKPIRFELSIAIFLITIALMTRGLADRSGRDAVGWLVGISMAVEISIIVLQAARGVRSHGNTTTSFDATLAMLMALFIVVGSLGVAWLLALWCTVESDVVAWGVRLGLLVLLCGSVEGGLMIARGAHTVGGVDGGAGLPIVGWSRQHGDLRVAHFFAIHALQLFPLVALGLARTSLRAKTLVLVAFVIVYGVAVVTLFSRAQRGMPLYHGARE